MQRVLSLRRAVNQAVHTYTKQIVVRRTRRGGESKERSEIDMRMNTIALLHRRHQAIDIELINVPNKAKQFYDSGF